MICPKCKANNSADESFCIKCGARLEGIAQKPESTEKSAEPWFKLKNRKVIAIGAGVILVLILTLVLVIVIQTHTSKSESLAQYIAKGIGHDMSDILKLEDVQLSEKSTYSGVTDYIKFDYLSESDKSVTADGVNLPEWLICLTSDDDKLESVTLYDFTVMEESYKGENTDSEIKLSTFSSGDGITKVQNYIDLDPYSICYESGQTVYTYKYYFTDTAGNEQARALLVTEQDGDYASSQSKTVYPAGLDD